MENRIFLALVDYDEEYSALFGGVLEDQRVYLELCIKAVLNLYKDIPNAPTTVTIVAHSMVSFALKTVEIELFTNLNYLLNRVEL